MACHLPVITVTVLILIQYVSTYYELCNQESVSPSVYLFKPGDSIRVYVNWTSSLTNIGSSYSCSLFVETCGHCRIKVRVLEPWFDYPACQRVTGVRDHCVQDCVYLILRDANYQSLQWRKVSNSLAANGFMSLSKRLQIIVCGTYNSQLNGTTRLRLTSIQKVQVLNGNNLQPASQRTIMSPDFPNPYVASNESFTYNLFASSPKEFITVTFDDWMLSPLSSIQFEGANFASRIYGSNVRPYVISKGNSMNLTFDTGTRSRVNSNSSFLGFKAVTRFYNSQQNIPNIETSCDYVVKNSEGGILHLNSATDGHNRDCVWVIKKLAKFDGVYLKVIRYKTRYGKKLLDDCNYSLEVRAGLTSMADLRLKIKPNEHILTGAVQLSEDGFYVRIKGCYFDDSLVLSYAMYSNDCDDYREHYKCDNGQCIPEHLRCDTFDHCGDNSDEIPNMCGPSSSNVSNADSGSYDYSVSIHIIIPLIVALVLGIGIMCLLIISVRRCRQSNATFWRRLPNDCAQQNRGRSRCWFNRGVQMSVTMSSGEHPPSYEDVIRSTPIGHLNMAFSWSPCDNTITQPPSYEEAVTGTSSTSQSFDGIVASVANTSSEYQREAMSALPHFGSLSAPVVTHSGNPQTDAQLSCSPFEDACGSLQILDILSSTENSAKNENDQIHNERCYHLTTFPISEPQFETKHQRNNVTFRSGTTIVSDDLSHLEVQTKRNVIIRHGKKKKENKHVSSHGRNQRKTAAHDDTVRDSTNVTRGRRAQSLDSLVISCSQNIGCEDVDKGHCQALPLEDASEAWEGSGKHERQQSDVCVVHPGHISLNGRIVSTDCDGYSSKVSAGVNNCSSRSSSRLNWCREPYSLRSRSCFDLSSDIKREELTDAAEGTMFNVKNVTSAGDGDVSLMEQSLNPFCNRINLLQEFNRSFDNLRETHRSRKQRNREYDAAIMCNDDDRDKCIEAVEVSRSRKNKSDVLKSSVLDSDIKHVFQISLPETGGKATRVMDSSRRRTRSEGNRNIDKTTENNRSHEASGQQTLP